MQKIVITGATGMIGTNLVRQLIKRNKRVLAIVRPNSPKIKNIKHPLVEIIQADLNELQNITSLPETYDTFYHLAWEGTRGADRNNVQMQLKNIEYTLGALRLANKIGCHTFIGTGSQAEYGKIEEKMAPDTPVKPETAYGIAKYCSGKMTQILANQLGIKHIWTRILSIYGPYDNENTLVMSSIREMIENHQSPEYTKGEQLWDYLYVEDAARALYLIGEKGINNSIYCIGSGKAKPLYQYIEEIKNQIDKNIELKLGAKEVPKEQIINLCADISNLTKDTGFIPATNFHEGIQKTIQWYRENKELLECRVSSPTATHATKKLPKITPTI